MLFQLFKRFQGLLGLEATNLLPSSVHPRPTLRILLFEPVGLSRSRARVPGDEVRGHASFMMPFDEGLHNKWGIPKQFDFQGGWRT